MAGAGQQRKWPSQLRRFLFSHKKFGPLHVLTMPSIHILKKCFNLMQSFEPKIHMTESDFLSITCSGGTFALLKSRNSCIQSLYLRLTTLSHSFPRHIPLNWMPEHVVSRTFHNLFHAFSFSRYHYTAVAALCDADGCLGLEGFIQVMHDQIRMFTKSSLADTSRFCKLK